MRKNKALLYSREVMPKTARLRTASSTFMPKTRGKTKITSIDASSVERNPARRSLIDQAVLGARIFS